MMNREAYEGVTDLGDFETVMYGIEPDQYYMIATSEHPLTAMYMDETIPEEQMPLRMVGVSQCFRREVGSHGQSDLGIWRAPVHQDRTNHHRQTRRFLGASRRIAPELR